MKHFFTTLIALFVAASCMAWGQKGHDTTCAIAQALLAPSARWRIGSVLDDKSIVYWSNWFDNAVHQPEYEYAKSWHYKNIDEGADYDNVPPFPDGDVVGKLQELYNILWELEDGRPWKEAESDSLKAAEALALKMFVHLMGDLHQPMHLGHATDLGGNKVAVKFFGRDANLHGVWDTNLVESGHAWSHSEWRDELMPHSRNELSALAAGDFKTWGRETFELAKQVYADTPEGSRISYDYVAKWTPVVEMQFVRGGVRMARLLNEIFASSDSEGVRHPHKGANDKRVRPAPRRRHHGYGRMPAAKRGVRINY